MGEQAGSQYSQLHRMWASGQEQTSLGRCCSGTRKSYDNAVFPSAAGVPKCHRRISVNQTSILEVSPTSLDHFVRVEAAQSSCGRFLPEWVAGSFLLRTCSNY